MNAQNPICPQCGSQGNLLYAGIEDYFFRSAGKWDFYLCTGKRCGIAWPFPGPDEDTLAVAYRNYDTHESKCDGRPASRLRIWIGRMLYRYGSTSLGRPLGRIPVLGWLVEEFFWASGGVTPDPTGMILDIGCGSGDRLALFSSIGWGSVVGVEPDARAVHAGHQLGRDIRIASAEALPVAENTTDAAVMHHVIEHVRCPQLAIAEAFRVLKPGIGRLVIITPNIASEMRTRWGRFWRGFEAPRHLTIFSVTALQAALSAAGFEVEVARTSARSSAWIEAVSSAASGSLGPAASIVGRLKVTERRFREQDRLIASGMHVGDEIVVIARKPSNTSAAKACF